jgi:hypothetical protein
MAGDEDSFSLGRQSAKAEALGLYRMLGHDGNTVEELRELISVPPKIECALCAFARAHPEEAHCINRNLKFRSRVLQEFERLVRDGLETDATAQSANLVKESSCD